MQESAQTEGAGESFRDSPSSSKLTVDEIRESLSQAGLAPPADEASTSAFGQRELRKTISAQYLDPNSDLSHEFLSRYQT